MDKGLGYWLQRTARLHRAKVAEALTDLGVFPGQERTLLALHGQKTMSVGELARALGTRAPTASKTLARLAAQGLVEREPAAGKAAPRKRRKAATRAASDDSITGELEMTEVSADSDADGDKAEKAKAKKGKDKNGKTKKGKAKNGKAKNGKRRARLTAEGTRRATILAGRMEDIEESLLAPLEEKDGRRLRKLLRKVSKSLTNEVEPLDGEDDTI